MSSSKKLGYTAIMSILGVSLVIMLMTSILRGNNDISFVGFLSYLGGCPSIETRFIINDLTIRGDWGLFNGFKQFLNIIISPFSFSVFLVSNLINVLLFLFYILRFIL